MVKKKLVGWQWCRWLELAKNNFIAHIIRKLLNVEMCECCECANIKPTLPKYFKTQYTLLWIITCQGLWENDTRQYFYCHTDSFCSGLPYIAFFYSTLTCLSMLFCLFLCMLSVLLSSWNFHPKMAAALPKAPPSGCYLKRIRVSPLGLLYSLASWLSLPCNTM